MTAVAEVCQVQLTEAECRMAVAIGCERRIQSIRARRRDTAGPVQASAVWTIDIEGAAAELAFAKAVGCYWDGSVGTFHHRPDVGPVHVRFAARAGHQEHHAHLIIRQGDPDGIYALVTGLMPAYQVHGWAQWPGTPSFEATPDPERDPCRFIRQADLRPISDLVPW